MSNQLYFLLELCQFFHSTDFPFFDHLSILSIGDMHFLDFSGKKRHLVGFEHDKYINSLIQKNKNKGNVVDNSVVFNRPSIVGQLHQSITALLHLSLLVIRNHQLQDLIVLNKLPHSV